MIKAPINKIIECSTVDGPGLRTSIFVQKCNIHCLYCHNPETQNMCINCGQCVLECPAKALSLIDGKVIWNKNICISCDHCIQICKHNASPKIEYMDAREVYDRIYPNRMFIRGITVSGGECSLYPEFLEELFALAKKDNLTCLMDSNGMIDYSKYPKLMELTDGVMLDIKSWSNDVYRRLVGFDNTLVKKNLKYLDEIGKIQELRIVVIDDYVDSIDCIDGIKETVQQNHLADIHLKLISFRKNGVKGVLSNHPSQSSETMEMLKKHAFDVGFRSVEIR